MSQTDQEIPAALSPRDHTSLIGRRDFAQRRPDQRVYITYRSRRAGSNDAWNDHLRHILPRRKAQTYPIVSAIAIGNCEKAENLSSLFEYAFRIEVL